MARESLKKIWCFTCNNYTDADIENFSSLYPATCRYVFFAKEIGKECGTPHLQGYLILNKGHRMTQMKKLCSRSHWEATRGSKVDNYEYCTKEGREFFEFGTNETNQGQRSDLSDLMKSVKDGCYDLKRLREDFPDVVAKYPRFVSDYVMDHCPMPEIIDHPLREWQAELNAKLNLPPNDREVIFVVDAKGNQGKTWFAKRYCSLHPENSQYMEAAKRADLAYALNPMIRVLFVNCVRKQTEFLNYGFLESVKDGIVFSSKYESRNKLLGPCHVVVLMNQDPDETALSHDRYKIITCK